MSREVLGRVDDTIALEGKLLKVNGIAILVDKVVGVEVAHDCYPGCFLDAHWDNYHAHVYTDGGKIKVATYDAERYSDAKAQANASKDRIIELLESVECI